VFGSETNDMRPLSYFLAVLLALGPASGEVVAAPAEVFEFDEFALYVPADVPAIRGIFLALGGPDTRAFVTDGLFGSPVAETEASLHLLSQELRAFAADHRLAILGTSRSGTEDMPNQPRSDEVIFKAMGEAARISGHPELNFAPLFLYGMSGGTPQTIGFTARNPERVGALLLKVPGPPERLVSAVALAVPSYVLFAEHDQFNDNSAPIAAIEFNRRAGGLWAFAVEPGVPHHSMTSSHRAITINWLRAIVELRLGASMQDPLRDVPESSGWLGHPDIGVSNWNDYTGDRRAASWFPSRATAEEWWEFVGAPTITRPGSSAVTDP
jgi:dienelactone hydrolase